MRLSPDSSVARSCASKALRSSSIVKRGDGRIPLTTTRPKAASVTPAPLEDAAPPPPPGNKPPTDDNWGNGGGGGGGGGEGGENGNNNDDNFSGSLFVPFASLGVAAIIASFLAKFVRSESDKKVKEENERVRRNANLPTSAMRPPDGKNVVYVGQKQDEERRRVTESMERREREEELKRRKAAMDAANTTKSSVEAERTGVVNDDGNKASNTSNSTKAPKQSAEELMAEAMRHYVDLETEKKEKEEKEARERQALEELQQFEDAQQRAEIIQQQQQMRKPAPPPPQQRQPPEQESFDIPAPMRGKSHESNSTSTRSPRLMRALSLAADARTAADQAVEAAEAAAYAAAELQATLVDRDGPPLNREKFRKEFRQRLAAQYDDDNEQQLQQQRHRSGRYSGSRGNSANAYSGGTSSSVGAPSGRRSMHQQHRARQQQERRSQTKSQKLLESTEMWLRDTVIPTAKVATVKTVEFARENYPHVKEATLKTVAAAKQEADKVRSTEKFKKFETFVKEKARGITQEVEKIAKKTIEEPTVIVDELQKGAKDMARESVHLWDKHVAPIVVNPELVEEDNKKNNKKKENRKQQQQQQHQHEKKRR